MTEIEKNRVIIARDDFGVLEHVQRDYRGSVWIYSDSGHKLEMTTKFPCVNAVEIKAKSLIGKKVRIFTSQTKASWSSLRYFCGLENIEVDKDVFVGDFWKEISGEDGYICDGYNIND